MLPSEPSMHALSRVADKAQAAQVAVGQAQSTLQEICQISREVLGTSGVANPLVVDP